MINCTPGPPHCPRWMVQHRAPFRSGAEMKAGAELPTLHRPPFAVTPAHCTTAGPAAASVFVLASAVVAAGVAVTCTTPSSGGARAAARTWRIRAARAASLCSRRLSLPSSSSTGEVAVPGWYGCTFSKLALVQLDRFAGQLLSSPVALRHRRDLRGAWRRRAHGAHLTAARSYAVCLTGAEICCAA